MADPSSGAAEAAGAARRPSATFAVARGIDPGGRPPDEGGRPAHTITLLGKPGCHLCDEARTVIARVAAELGVPWQERDITLSEQDQREYWDKIPVTFIDGVQHDFWRVSEQRLRAALGAEPA